MKFSRKVTNAFINKIQKELLFSGKLLADIQSMNVFPAIRNGYIDFYHNGYRIFEYKDRFKTHKKFLPLFQSKDDYISEDMISNLKILDNFFDQYEEIKSASGMYAGLEAKGVSYLYSQYSFMNEKSDVVVLDIEISFRSNEKTRNTDRIDILLFSKKNNCLGFVEAKHYSNSCIWANDENRAKVFDQISVYDKQIVNRQMEILDVYSEYVKNLNTLFKIDLPIPQKIKSKCGLYIFGFDKMQKDRLDPYMKSNISKHCNNDLGYYSRGDAKKIAANTLWNKIFCDISSL